MSQTMLRFLPDGLPMPKEFGQAAKDGSKKTYKFALDYYPAKRDQLFTRVGDVTSGERSFRYRLPAQVKARLEEITKQGTDPESVKSCADGKFFMAQYGTMLSLPATRHSKSLTYNLALIESTGGLKTFTLGTTGSLDAASITALGTATGAMLRTRNAAAQKAAAAANAVDPALAKQDATIKAQDEICTIQKKYNLPCTIQPQ